MEILNKLTALSESLGMGKTQVEEVKSDVEAFGQIKFDEGKALGITEGKALGLAEGEAIGYQKGFDAGVASVGGEVPVPSDKVYSQIEMDAALIAKSIEVKSVIKAKYDEAQAAESVLEASVFAEPVV